MALELSENATLDYDKEISGVTWLLLMEFTYTPTGTEDPPGTIRVCLNNEEVKWKGHTWSPAAFSLSGIEESKETTSTKIDFQFFDVTRMILPIVEKYRGAIGAVVNIHVVISSNLDTNGTSNSQPPELSIRAVVDGTSLTPPFSLTMTLARNDLAKLRCPQQKYFKDSCTSKFKSSRCGYTGSETECRGSLVRCRELNNSVNFRGFPGTGVGGYIAEG